MDKNQLNAEADVVKPTQTNMINEMNNLTKNAKYCSQAVPKIIKFSSRASVKITNKGQDHYYTIEYGEERQINNFENVDIDKERQLLIDDCNDIVDEQIKEIVETFLK